MRIDLTQTAASQIASEPNSKPVSEAQVSATDLADGGDRATLSSTPQSLSALVSTAMSSPEIRQNKVDALTRAVNSGAYELDPEKIAASMIDEHA